MTRVRAWRHEALRCNSCHGQNLVHTEAGAFAPPLFDRNLDGSSGVLVVAEAPNWDDTYNPAKGYLTYDRNTDPTGRFAVHLLQDVAGLATDHVIFTNAVLCLPASSHGKYVVREAQKARCAPVLRALIEAASPAVIVTFGAVPLDAVSRIEPHRLQLASAAGRLYHWFGRALVPLYHPSRLGRANRRAAEQERDVEVLRRFTANGRIDRLKLAEAMRM